jgi:hypothetical protein
MIADVDAASVITAAENGALYDTGLVWLLVLGYDIRASRSNLSPICNVLLGLIASKNGLWVPTHSEDLTGSCTGCSCPRSCVLVL